MSERLFKNVDACQDMVVEALKYHLLPDRRQSMHSRRTQPRKSYIGQLFAFGADDSGKLRVIFQRHATQLTQAFLRKLKHVAYFSRNARLSAKLHDTDRDTSQCQSPTSRHVKMLECGKFLSVGGEFVVYNKL